MFNSMNYGRRKEDNPIYSLPFIWKAEFLDKSTIYQYDKENIEHRFQEVKDKFDKLVYFCIYNKYQKFTVDLTNGIIIYNNFKTITGTSKKNNIRLIFFRRHKIEIGLNNLSEKNHEIIYFLGFQYNNKEGNNCKILLQIDKNGSWVLGE